MTTPPAVPGLLYHATRISAMDSIGAQGLIGNPYVFAAESAEEAMRFIAFRLRVAMTGRLVEHEIKVAGAALEEYRSRANGDSTVRVDDEGRVFVQVPEIEHHTAAAMLEIDTTKTDVDAWRVSDDHIGFFFGNAVSWAYTGNIPTAAVVGVTVIPLDPDPSGGGEPLKEAS